MVKATMKLCKRLFFRKIKKNMQGKSGMKYFTHSRVWRHSHRIQDFVTYNFVRTDQNTTKLCTRLFFHKIIKIMPQK